MPSDPNKPIGNDHAAWRDYFEDLKDYDHETLRVEAYRYRRLYEEVRRQLENLYKYADDANIELPSPGNGH
jgi:hypothetical protein